MKRQITIDGTKSDWYEKAIFILKEDANKNKFPKKLSFYADELVENYLKKKPIVQKQNNSRLQRRIDLFLTISIMSTIVASIFLFLELID